MAAELPNYCPNCGKKMTWMAGDEGGICAGCGQENRMAGGGAVQRFFRWLFSPRKPVRTGATRVVKTVTESQEFRVQDERTGQTKVYHGLEELPPEVRQRIEAFRGGDPAHRATEYTVRDESGLERTYHSVEEMPPDVRAMFERAKPR